VNGYHIVLTVAVVVFMAGWWTVDRLPYRRRGNTLRMVERGTVRKVDGGSTWKELP
jgi:hypothetical protein